MIGPPAPRRCQALCLSGGGYRGLFTASLLGRAEERWLNGRPARFDLFSGTSIGAIIAAGLALGVSAGTIAEAFRAKGPMIFPRVPVWTAAKQYVRAPYRTRDLRTAIEEILQEKADTSLREMDAPLLLTAVDITNGKTVVFRSRGLDPQAPDVPLTDALLASAAAPTYFPPVRIDTAQHVDGGLVANAPDLLVWQAMMTMGVRNADRYLLSVGTAGRREGAAIGTRLRPSGMLSWITARRLVQTTMQAQESLTLSGAQALLGSRYVRIDAEPTQKQAKIIARLDRADEKASSVLVDLARQAFERSETSPAFRDFFRA